MRVRTIEDTCPTCGNGLAPSGECHACLLQLGISQAGKPLADMAALPNLDTLNAQFPQLEIRRLVGTGGMGAIYHARQTTLDRDVALKLIRRDVSSDTAFVERFEREAKTLAKLSHPHIVTIYDFGHTADGIAYLIMEYVDGINLREAIESGGIDANEALDLVVTICRALKYAHSKGIVHRDIKPENILLGEDGSLKVVDFGIAKIFDESVRTPTLTATRQVLGSLHYLAPEHLESPQQVDHRVDLYALGVVFYELLTGQLPLGRYEPPSSVCGTADPRLDRLVLKMLSRRPEQRYQTAAELDADLGEILATRPAASSVESSSASSGGLVTTNRSVSVPFTCEALGGFAEAVGVVHARQDTLCFEFRIRDSIWGHVKSNTHLVEVPCQQLTRLEFMTGLFGSKLVVTADTISALGTLPNAETGRVELRIRRKDAPYGREVPLALGFTDNVFSRSAWRPFGQPSGPPPTSDARRTILSSFGATTLMFIRESRWAKVVGIANAVGAVLILAGFAVFQLGYYPSQMSYRVVDTNVPSGTLQTAIQNRLGRSSRVGDVDHDEQGRPIGLRIKTWHRGRREVKQRLQVPEMPRLVWLLAPDGHSTARERAAEEERASLLIPVVSGLMMEGLQTEKTQLGMAVMGAGEPYELLPVWVARITEGEANDAQLVVELTAVGREALAARLNGKEATAGLGLVIDGLMEGIAPLDAISPKRLVFQLSNDAGLAPESIATGIRGPGLPSPLELLE